MFSTQDSAILMGFVIVLIGVPLLVQWKTASKALLHFLKDTRLTQMAGMLTAVMGLFILKTSSQIGTSFGGIIALLGWATLLKGIFFTWFPKHASGLSKEMFNKSKEFSMLGGLVITALGVWLLWAGLGQPSMY